MKTEHVPPLVEQLQQFVLPLFRESANDLATALPGIHCSVGAQAVGSNTSYQGFQFSLSCLLPNREASLPDEVALVVDLCHLDRVPRLCAAVVWGHPSGKSEASLCPEALSSEEWPHVTQELFAELEAKLPALVAALRQAALRGGPSEA